MLLRSGRYTQFSRDGVSRHRSAVTRVAVEGTPTPPSSPADSLSSESTMENGAPGKEARARHARNMYKSAMRAHRLALAAHVASCADYVTPARGYGTPARGRARRPLLSSESSATFGEPSPERKKQIREQSHRRRRQQRIAQLTFQQDVSA